MKAIKRRRAPYAKFKEFLAKNRIKQYELALTLEKSSSALNQNINGTGGDFSLEELRIICVLFNISADEYFIRLEVSNMKQTEAEQHDSA